VCRARRDRPNSLGKSTPQKVSTAQHVHKLRFGASDQPEDRVLAARHCIACTQAGRVLTSAP
jgi:hypothetical protein